ncbi:ricin-type beta-trefoil lectin domain protein [Streptomyces sp. NPDC002577]
MDDALLRAVQPGHRARRRTHDRAHRRPPSATPKPAPCSSATTQQWSYESDGLLRSMAESDLCLDSQADDGAVTLGGCAGPKTPDAADVRYDLTVQGRLIPRWRAEPAVAPASPTAGSEIAVRVRDESAEQVWSTDSATTSPASRTVAEATSPPVRSTAARPRAGSDYCTPPVCMPRPPRAGSGSALPAPLFPAEAGTQGAYTTWRTEAAGAHGPYEV